MDCSVHAPKELKKEKVCNVAVSPLPQPYTPKATCLNFGIWGRVLDVINHAKFSSIGSGVLEPQLAENCYLPLTGGIALTTVYALTCYTDKFVTLCNVCS